MADGLPAASEQAAEMDWDAAGQILADAAKGADGEIFVEDTRTESFYWDDGRLKSASFDATQGFGLRIVAGERAGYGHASVLEIDAVARAAAAAKAVKLGHDGQLDMYEGLLPAAHADDESLQRTSTALDVLRNELADGVELPVQLRQCSASIEAVAQVVRVLDDEMRHRRLTPA